MDGIGQIYDTTPAQEAANTLRIAVVIVVSQDGGHTIPCVKRPEEVV
jgi:hypothetical protein